jgi:hypothetical protein
LFISEIKEEYMDPNLYKRIRWMPKTIAAIPWFKSNYVNRTNSSYRKRKVLKLEQAPKQDQTISTKIKK